MLGIFHCRLCGEWYSLLVMSDRVHPVLVGDTAVDHCCYSGRLNACLSMATVGSNACRSMATVHCRRQKRVCQWPLSDTNMCLSMAIVDHNSLATLPSDSNCRKRSILKFWATEGYNHGIDNV